MQRKQLWLSCDLVNVTNPRYAQLRLTKQQRSCKSPGGVSGANPNRQQHVGKFVYKQKPCATTCGMHNLISKQLDPTKPKPTGKSPDSCWSTLPAAAAAPMTPQHAGNAGNKGARLQHLQPDHTQIRRRAVSHAIVGCMSCGASCVFRSTACAHATTKQATCGMHCVTTPHHTLSLLCRRHTPSRGFHSAAVTQPIPARMVRRSVIDTRWPALCGVLPPGTKALGPMNTASCTGIVQVGKQVYRHINHATPRERGAAKGCKGGS